jgi:hypothetical protein
MSTTSSLSSRARLGHHIVGQKTDHLLADVPVELRQHLAVDPASTRAPATRPLARGHLFQKVGDIGGVQRRHQRVDHRDLARLDRLTERAPQAVVERIGVAPSSGASVRVSSVCSLIPATPCLHTCHWVDFP